MKCEICGKDILKDSQCIDYKYYHNDCIINLTKENKELKEHIEKYEYYYKTTGIEDLVKDNKKYKEVIDKLKTNIKNDIDGFRTINEFGESNEILELLDIYLDILKGVE